MKKPCQAVFSFAEKPMVKDIPAGKIMYSPPGGRTSLSRRFTLRVDSICRYVEELKYFLGVKIGLPGDTCLASFLRDYEKWCLARYTVDPMQNPPDSVLLLGNVSWAVSDIRRHERNVAALKYLKERLLSDTANFSGILFELRTVLHYKLEHPTAKWIGHERGEFDVAVITNSGNRVCIECSIFAAKPERIREPLVFAKDLQAKLKAKTRQIDQREDQIKGSAILLVFFVPENIDWRTAAYVPQLDGVVEEYYRSQSSEMVTDIMLVADTPPSSTAVDSLNEYDTDIACYRFGENPRAQNAFPTDFHIMLRLDG